MKAFLFDISSCILALIMSVSPRINSIKKLSVLGMGKKSLKSFNSTATLTHTAYWSGTIMVLLLVLLQRLYVMDCARA